MYEPAIIAAANSKYHDEYRLLNALDIEAEFGPRSFDAVCAFDIVEHLPKTESAVLIKAMEHVARKVVIISSPNGYVPWTPSSGNPWQAHKCGWAVEEMQAMGYNVLGTCGWRRLRNRYNWLGPFHDGRFFHLQMFVFDITQILVKKRPELAHQLLCFKVLCPEV
jgi:2-polyprenyl-3-methyl-5-hydroxy-6-metoxy-1,4-benzoquinol methylase